MNQCGLSTNHIVINYEIECYNRFLTLEVAENDEAHILDLIDDLYYKWLENDTCECCEEYILNGLDEANIQYKTI